MRLLSFLTFLLPLTITAQLPESSRQAWADSLSPNPQNVYSPVVIAGGGAKYKTPTSAITQWSNPTYYQNSPGFMDSAPTFDPIQYRFPDVTFNATFTDGYPRAWHIWFPRGYKKTDTDWSNGVFQTDSSNKNRFNIWYVLHGFTDNAFYPYYDGQQEWPGMPIWSNLTAFTYYNNYILVAPEGLINKVNIAANEIYPEFAWNAGKCCSSLQPPQDDVEFLTQVRNNITALFKPKKQFLTGYSNGGFMVNRMACEKRNLFDGFVANAGPVNYAGATVTDILNECDTQYAKTSGPAKPMLFVHGQNDQRVSYQGTTTSVSANDNFVAWARRNGCKNPPSPSIKLYKDNTGLTSNYLFNTVESKRGYKVFVYPPGLNASTFHGNPRYFNLNRLPFAPTAQAYAGSGCTPVALISHYDFHVWPKKYTSVSDDWVFQGNGIFDLNEYAHQAFQLISWGYVSSINESANATTINVPTSSAEDSSSINAGVICTYHIASIFILCLTTLLVA